MVSKIEVATRPTTSTSRVLKARCTSTLSMTTWRNSGEIKANSCRKNNATSPSLKRRRYLWIAPRNQVMSNRRGISDNPARRVIRISRPSQNARSSAPRVKAGGGSKGGLNKDFFLSTLGAHQEAAIGEGRDGWQGRPGKPRPVGPVGT